MTATQTACETDRAAPPVVTTAALMQGRRVLVILHEGEAYTLRVTRQNRLLLTK